ncbi:MAG: alpha-amylase/alpha-mannosidase [Planctomycetota bacterium]|nr:MAG: alpha-amylase/alpha-mannosidase [Planctomycetota bacterium]
MQPVSLAIVWHQHQPYYPDDISGDVLMPWVRFHATKDYIGMALHIQEVPEFRCTINLVPSLLVQLQRYVDGGSDRHLDVSRLPVDGLAEVDAQYLVENFFAANMESMIRPHARYLELHRKRHTQPADFRSALARFSLSELRDLQVWHNLSWFHELLFETDRELREFRHKARDYTEADKHWLLQKQREVIARVIPLHKHLEDSGQIEITTTPFYHPIMPLLWDKRAARQGMPDCQLPQSIDPYPEDVRRHLKGAIELHEKCFGRKPRGMWPSEGSVSQEILPALIEHGIEWIATDEEVLSRSLDGQMHRRRHGDRGLQRPDLLYQPWVWDQGARPLQMIFRDHGLSDFIGFDAQRIESVSAAHTLINSCVQIGRAVRGDHTDTPVLVPVILDGENCWESFRDGGVLFLRTLYREAVRHAEVQPTRVGDYLKKHPPQARLPKLHAGSWIDANFYIWIGHSEDREAWDVLHETRAYLKKQEASGQHQAELIARAWREIDIAEGSDWCWWYGDDRNSGQDDLFDLLYRRHLQNVYRLFGESPPTTLLRPICKIQSASLHTQPVDLLRVIPDGRRRFFDWKPAGVFIAGSERGTMARVTEGLIRKLHFGFDETTLLIRCDTLGRTAEDLLSTYELRIRFVEPDGHEVRVRCDGTICWGAVLLRGVNIETSAVQAGVYDFAVIAIPLADLNLTSGQACHFFVEVFEERQSIDRIPSEGLIQLTVPPADFSERIWQV